MTKPGRLPPRPDNLTVDEPGEIWRPVLTHPGRYEVSSLGRVRVCARKIVRGCVVENLKPILLKTAIGGRRENYLRVRLHNPERHAYVHHLVCEAFHGPKPFPAAVVLHGGQDSFDNRAGNLRWGTAEENETDRHVVHVAKSLPPALF